MRSLTGSLNGSNDGIPYFLETHFRILQTDPLMVPMMYHQKVHCLGIHLKMPAVGPTCEAFLRPWFIAWRLTYGYFILIILWFQ